jgi:hypothetical protein
MVSAGDAMTCDGDATSSVAIRGAAGSVPLIGSVGNLDLNNTNTDSGNGGGGGRDRGREDDDGVADDRVGGGRDVIGDSDVMDGGDDEVRSSNLVRQPSEEELVQNILKGDHVDPQVSSLVIFIFGLSLGKREPSAD